MHKYFIGFQTYYVKAKHEEMLKKHAEIMEGNPSPSDFYKTRDDFRMMTHKFHREML